MTHSLTSVRFEKHATREEHAPLGERKSEHVSVLLDEAIAFLDLQEGNLVVDMTAGAGGHSEAILRANKKVKLIAIDADVTAVERTRKRLAPIDKGGARTEVLAGNFRDIEGILDNAGVEKIDKALFDLGWNSNQLEEGRGFSFQTNEPLNMSYGEKPASGFTARDILNTWEENVIADVLFGYGEERYAKRIAKAVIERRDIQPIETTIEFVELIKDSVPSSYRHGRLHPATRSFQALRIAVNDELGSIEKGIHGAWMKMQEGGRIVVITFHSIEDRLVKRLFLALAKKNGKLLVKKPLVPSEAEIKRNPRARSAKLRAIEKI